MAIKEKIAKKEAEGKANAKDAAKAKNKAAMKKAADKLILDMVAELPAGEGKSFIALVGKLDKLDEQTAVINLTKRGVRGELKEMKIELRALDRVRKLRKMEPEDRKALKATEANYESQLGMELTAEQKTITAELSKKRAETRAALTVAAGNDVGKEIGSQAGVIPARTELPPIKDKAIVTNIAH